MVIRVLPLEAQLLNVTRTFFRAVLACHCCGDAGGGDVGSALDGANERKGWVYRSEVGGIDWQ